MVDIVDGEPDRIARATSENLLGTRLRHGTGGTPSIHDGGHTTYEHPWAGTGRDAELSPNSHSFRHNDSSDPETGYADGDVDPLGHFLCSHKSYVLSRLDLLAYRAEGARQVGNATEETNSAGCSGDKAEKRPPKRALQRWERGGNDDRDSQSESEEEDDRRRRKKKKQPEDEPPTQCRLLLACPFFQHDPVKYGTWRSCPGPGWPTTNRLKYAMTMNVGHLVTG